MIIRCAKCRTNIFEFIESEATGDRFMGRMFRRLPNSEWQLPHPTHEKFEMVCPLCTASFLNDNLCVVNSNGTAYSIEDIQAMVTPIVKNNGEPFSSEQAARMAAGRMKLKDWKVVPLRSGYGIITGESGDMTSEHTT
jgi:hypothetical protein